MALGLHKVAGSLNYFMVNPNKLLELVIGLIERDMCGA